MRWLARGEGHVPSGVEWLNDAEAARAASMPFTKRRTEYLLRRYAGKCAVAAAIGVPEDPVSLGRIAVLNRWTGAPYVEVDGRDLGMDVSLTDRAGWAVCLIGADLAAVGCDLEIVEPRSDGFVSDFLTPSEQLLVREAASGEGSGGSQPQGEAQHAMANLIWSAKESALKVLRTGLRADTRTVEVAIDWDQPAPGSGWHPLRVHSSSAVLPGWWRRDGVFLLTIVTSGPTDPPRELPGSMGLAAAEPIHSWMVRPLV